MAANRTNRTTRASGSAGSVRSRGSSTVGAPAELYDAMQALVRVYQLRDRDRACYGSITPNECYALEAIERAGSISVNALAAALGLHKSNASRIVDALEAKRLVRRRADATDGRAWCLEVTPTGTGAHAAIRAGIERRYAELLEDFPEETRVALVALVRALGAEAAARIGRPACASAEPGKESSCS